MSNELEMLLRKQYNELLVENVEMMEKIEKLEKTNKYLREELYKERKPFYDSLNNLKGVEYYAESD